MVFVKCSCLLVTKWTYHQLFLYSVSFMVLLLNILDCPFLKGSKSQTKWRETKMVQCLTWNVSALISGKLYQNWRGKKIPKTIFVPLNKILTIFFADSLSQLPSFSLPEFSICELLRLFTFGKCSPTVNSSRIPPSPAADSCLLSLLRPMKPRPPLLR